VSVIYESTIASIGSIGPGGKRFRFELSAEKNSSSIAKASRRENHRSIQRRGILTVRRPRDIVPTNLVTVIGHAMLNPALSNRKISRQEHERD
jgi:hypothetical protein